MKRSARTLARGLIGAVISAVISALISAPVTLTGLAQAAGAGQVAEKAGADPATLPQAPIFLAPAVPDPESRVRLAAWWRHFEAARPALSVVAVRLRSERNRWREGSDRERCRTARRALAEVDSAVLRRGVDYMLTLEIGTALDEFDRAAAACLEERYFEFDYRLQVAEAALTTARRRAAAQLARPAE